ncbi:MAG TPA: replication-relaxation family protein [Amycolatopsis sp.]|nr:replication-relaxation family protein [Amycolatopsis sp.]
MRPDGYGCWESGGRAVRFFLEYDTGTESLRVLARKITAYSTFYTDRFGVLLFSLHSARREQAFRAGLVKFLGGHDPGVVIATTARDLPGADDPAGDVWALWSGRDHGPVTRLTLANLPERGPRVRHHTPELPYGKRRSSRVTRRSCCYSFLRPRRVSRCGGTPRPVTRPGGPHESPRRHRPGRRADRGAAGRTGRRLWGAGRRVHGRPHDRCHTVYGVRSIGAPAVRTRHRRTRDRR